MFESRTGQRLAGLIVLILGGALMAWTWYSALTGDGFYIEAAVLAPVLVVFGIGMILVPIDIQSLREEHGVPKPGKLRFAHYPIHWKAVSVVAVVAGFANWLVLTWN